MPAAPDTPGFRDSQVSDITTQHIFSSPGTGIFVYFSQHLLKDTQLSQFPRNTSCLYTLTFFKELQNLILLFVQSQTDVVLGDSLVAQRKLSQHPALQKAGGEFVFQSWPRVQPHWQRLIQMQSSACKDYVLGICLYFCLLLLYEFKKPFEILIWFTINRYYIFFYHQITHISMLFFLFCWCFPGLVSHGI